MTRRTLLESCTMAALAFALIAAPALADGPPEGFTSLFDGKTLKGWTQRNGTATYEVKDGTIVGTTHEGSPNSFLCSDKDYGDFELRFEVKCDSRLNSGVQVRSQTKGGDPKGRVNGPQVEIEGSPGQSGYIYGEATGLGWLSPEPNSKDKSVSEHSYFKNNEWNQYRVIAKGPRFQTWINGHPIADLTHEGIYKTHPKGFLGLQVHAIGKGQGPYHVAWRDIYIKEIK
jgi:3-keto-disaccharide hydrolase